MIRWKVMVSVAVVSALAVGMMFVVFQAAKQRTAPHDAGETAKSGSLLIGVEPSLETVTAALAPVFIRHYPDAVIDYEAGSYEELFNRFLNKEIRAMLVSGTFTSRESAFLENYRVDFRLEPVAKDAMLCVVNDANPVQSLRVDELAEIFTARKTSWESGFSDKKEILPVLNRKEKRLQQLFGGMTGVRNEEHLTAWLVDSNRELLRVVAQEKEAVGVLPFSSFQSLLASFPDSSSLRIVALSERKGELPVLPSQFTLYHEKYPLVYPVNYVYRKNEALAAGFGAWLAEEGQKGFMRSAFAPYRQPVRVITLE